MLRFGFLGAQPIDQDNPFEVAVERALGDVIRADEAVAKELWSAMANIHWFHAEHGEAAYSFRAAGGLVADIRGEGNYMDWYCASPEGVVSERITTAMAGEGWGWRSVDADVSIRFWGQAI